MYAENELLFPTHVIPALRQARGDAWRALIERITPLPEDHPQRLAFSLMMIRLDGCLTCETDSYRAMRGCKACARQMLRRHKGSDDTLLQVFAEALEDVEAFLRGHRISVSIEQPLSAAIA
ncbi:MAG: hypothetical protein E4G99_08935 [Anaerolineales bacterium]|nr:MAG: hypothetical protein E4G99_08935 [Anaerolineales bacterium]